MKLFASTVMTLVILGCGSEQGGGRSIVPVTEIPYVPLVDVQSTEAVNTSAYAMLAAKGAQDPTEIAPGPDGGFLIAGTTRSTKASIFETEALVIRTDASGTILWSRAFGEEGEDRAEDVILTSDGTVVVAGKKAIPDAETEHAWVARLDADGGVIWEKTYKYGKSSSFAEIIENEDGGFVLAGTTTDGDYEEHRALLVATDAEGTETWKKTYKGTGARYAKSVQSLAGGGYCFGGSEQYKTEGKDDMWVGKTNASGELLWEVALGMEAKDESFSDMVCLEDGSIIAGGWRRLNKGTELVLYRVSSEGTIVWDQDHDPFQGSQELGPDIAVMPDGGIVLAASTNAYGDVVGAYVYYIYSIDEQGETVWSHAMSVYGYSVHLTDILCSGPGQVTLVSSLRPMKSEGGSYTHVQVRNESDIMFFTWPFK